MVKDAVNAAGGLGFDSGAGQIDEESQTARHRCDILFGAVLPRYAKPRRWTPLLATCFSGILSSIKKI